MTEQTHLHLETNQKCFRRAENHNVKVAFHDGPLFIINYSRCSAIVDESNEKVKESGIQNVNYHPPIMNHGYSIRTV